MVIDVALLLGALVCAVLAVHSRPLNAALWLAGLSALLAGLFFRLGAIEIAVIELSVGAGLITVLLAFAVGMAEDETEYRSLINRPTAVMLVVLTCALLAWLVLPQIPPVTNLAAVYTPFVFELWNNRMLDLVVQSAAVVAGVIGVISLFGETRRKFGAPEAEIQEATHE